MPALPKITNPLHPRISRSWISPIRFRTKPFLKLSQSLSEALKELEVRFPSHQKTPIDEWLTRRLRRKAK